MIATAVLCSLALHSPRATPRVTRRAALLGAATTLALPRVSFAADDFAQKADAALARLKKAYAANDEPALKQALADVRAVESLAELRLESQAAAAKAAATKADPSSVFVGRYSDPDYPGGTRVITLEQGAGTPSLGIFKLAKVEGGGGDGEPAFFSLPAMVGGDTSITVDFRPKGGAKDVTGAWDGDGIQFPGVKWMKIQ